MLLDRARSQLLIVDVQERLLPAMHDPEAVENGCNRLIRAAQELSLPLTVSEQYPKGLGPTVAGLRDLLADDVVLAKTEFSCAGNPEIMARMTAADRQQVVIAGIEAHVCVLQTAVTLRERGYEPVVVMDASSSRQPESQRMAGERLRANGVEMVTGEMVLFEWLRQAGTPEFKALSGLIK